MPLGDVSNTGGTTPYGKSGSGPASGLSGFVIPGLTPASKPASKTVATKAAKTPTTKAAAPTTGPAGGAVSKKPSAKRALSAKSGQSKNVQKASLPTAASPTARRCRLSLR